MEVTLLRGRDGRVIFMECPGRFVDTVVAIAEAPLGSVLGAVAANGSLGAGQVCPGAGLRESMGSLRGLQMPSALFKPVDLERFAAAGASVPVPVPRTSQVTHQQAGSRMELTSAGGGWTTNAVFDVGGRTDFEFSFRGELANPMFGIAPASVNPATNQLYATSGFHMQVPANGACVLYSQGGTSNKPAGLARSGDLLKMRLTNGGTSPLLQYAFGDGPFVTAVFNSAIPPDPTYCPVVCFHTAGQRVTVEDTSDPVRQVTPPSDRFLVTNRLQVLENSTATGIELISQRNGESLAGLRSEAASITAATWRRLIAGALLGRDDILDFAFPAGGAAGATGGPSPADPRGGDAASTAGGGSDSSFEITFPEGQAA